MNLQIIFFKEQLNKIISESQLPIGVVKQILSNVLHEIQILYDYQIEKEKEELKKQQSIQINQNNQINNNQVEQEKNINNEQDFNASLKDSIIGWTPEKQE